jgi:hypothetical protein
LVQEIMARDSGRYDAFTDTWIDDNVQVDFAWGNIPMQPNDDREEPLDPALDSHIIATSGYEGFPAFVTGGIFDDTIDNAIMPNLVGLTQQQATTALTNAGLTGGASGGLVTEGATSQNNGKVASQSPAAGTAVNVDVDVTWTIYNYVVAGGPIAGFNNSGESAGVGMLGMDEKVMYLVGRTVKPTVGSSIVISGVNNSGYNATWTVISVVNNDSYNTGGTAVKIKGHMIMDSNGTGGNWVYA